MPPDKDQNQTAPGAAPTQEQPQTPQSEQPVSQEPPGQFTPPASDIPVGPQEPTIPQPETGQPLAETPEPGPVFPPSPTTPGPTMPGPTIAGPEPGPVFPSPPPPPPPPTPTPVVGSAPKSGGNTMQKIRLLLILIPILVLLVIVIFVATSFLGKARSKKGSTVTPTPTAGTAQPTLPPIGPGGFAQTPTPTPAFSGGVYRDSTNGFSIEPPTGWVQQKGTGLVTFQNPEEDLDAAGNKFNVNLLVSKGILSAGQTFDSYIEQTKRELTILSEYQKVSDVKGSLAGQPAFQTDLTWKLGVHKVRQRLVGIQKGQDVFLLTATSTSTTWDKYQLLFEKSISSFTFTGLSI